MAGGNGTAVWAAEATCSFSTSAPQNATMKKVVALHEKYMTTPFQIFISYYHIFIFYNHNYLLR